MAGSIPLLYGIVSGHTVFKLDIVKPKYTRLLLMAVYLGGTMSGILVRYMIWDPVQVLAPPKKSLSSRAIKLIPKAIPEPGISILRSVSSM